MTEGSVDTSPDAPASWLVAYTGGRPYLELVDLQAARTISLATPLDRRESAVDNGFVRDGYAVLHSGTELAISIPSDLAGGAHEVCRAWETLPALDERLVWSYRYDWRRPDEPGLNVLTDQWGNAAATLELPRGLRLHAETNHGFVVGGDQGIGIWDPDRAIVTRSIKRHFLAATADGLVACSSGSGLEVWDLRADNVRPVPLPPGVARPGVAALARSAPLIAWDRQSSGPDGAVVIVDLQRCEAVAHFTIEVPYLGSLCWSADDQWLFASFWNEPIVRRFKPDGSETHDTRFGRSVGNLLFDLGPVEIAPTTKRLMIDYDGAASGRVPDTASEKQLIDMARKALREEVGLKQAKAVLAVATPAVRLVADEHGASRIGGLPQLTAGQAWPIAEGVPLSLLAQIDLAELRRAWSKSPFPRAGSLAMFFGPLGFADEILSEAAAVVHVGATRSEVASPPGLMRPPFEAVAVRPRLVLTLPVDAYELVGDDVADRAAELFAELWGTATGPMHQVGGHPAWVQGGAPGELLLQVDCDSESGMAWGEGGRVFFMVDAGEMAASDFTNVHALMECY